MSVYVSSLLTATAATVNADPASTRTWQWQRNGVNIPDATNPSYSAAPADIGANIAVVQTETNFLGTNNATSASVGPVVSFSPIAFFGDGSPGWWYDNDDITTLFQDSAGTTPVTAVEQTVGLQLDKSKGLVLGPELVTNGDFSNGTTGWTGKDGAVLSAVSNDLSVNALVPPAVNNYGGAYTTVSLVSGKHYKLSVTFKGVSSSVSVFVRTSSGFPGGEFFSLTLTSGQAQNATHSGIFVATATTNKVLLVECAGSAGQFVIDSISVRELPGNHRFQATPGSRPTWSKRVNRLTKTEQFDDAAWLKSTSPAISLTNQGSGVWRLQASAGVWLLYQRIAGMGSTQARFSIEVKSNGAGLDSFRIMLGGVNATGNLTATDQWVRYSATAANSGSGDTGIVVSSGATAIDVLIRFPDLRFENQATGTIPLYQRVNTATDYETTGFPGYFRANGSSQWMQTNSVSFTATDKITLCAGVRKLAATALGVVGTVCELSASVDTNNGSFLISAPLSNVGDYGFHVRSTALADRRVTVGTYPAPVTNVLSCAYNLSQTGIAAEINAQINGSVPPTTDTGATGTGNFGNYPAYFFARAGSSNFFNGEEYSNVTVGKLLTADQVAALELYTANQMKLALLPTDYQNLTSAGDNLTDSSGLNLLYAQPIY